MGGWERERERGSCFFIWSTEWSSNSVCLINNSWICVCVCPTPFLYFSFPPECVCVCVRVEPWPRERKKRLLCLCVCEGEGLKLLTQREYNDHCHIYNKSLCCLCWPLPWQNGGQSGGLCCYMLCFEWNWITLGNWIWCAHDPLFIDGRVVERKGDCRQCYYLVIWVSLRLCVCVCV